MKKVFLISSLLFLINSNIFGQGVSDWIREHPNEVNSMVNDVLKWGDKKIRERRINKSQETLEKWQKEGVECVHCFSVDENGYIKHDKECEMQCREDIANQKGQAIITSSNNMGIVGYSWLLVDLEEEGKRPVVTDVMPNTPASEIFQIGDMIISINEVNTYNITKDQIQDLTSGGPGTVIKYIFKRGNDYYEATAVKINPLSNQTSSHGIVGFQWAFDTFGYPIITGIVPNTPAESFFLIGDRIIKVNGIDTYNKSESQLTEMWQGGPGTRIKFVIGRGPGYIYEATLVKISQ